jgi:hypothetical protein
VTITGKLPRRADDLVLVVTGGRDLTNEAFVWTTLDAIHAKTPIGYLAEGGCETGADLFACNWREARGVDGKTFAAEWTVHVCYHASKCRLGPMCRSAGPVRNRVMLRTVRPGLVVAFPSGGPGTKDCCDQAKGMGRRVEEFRE